MKKLLTIAFFTCISSLAFAQSGNVYDLLTENYNDRPMSLYKGFLQLSPSYTYSMANNYFDVNGTILPFNESVKSMLENNYGLAISYGILDWLELYTSINYRKRFESISTNAYFSGASLAYENTLYRIFGPTNLDLGIKISNPFVINNLNFYIGAGASLPISNQNEKEPAHTISIDDPANPESSYYLDYEFRPAPGSPCTFYSLIAGLKYTFNNFGLQVNSSFINPISEVETFQWDYRLYGNLFEYKKNYYNIQDKGVFTLNAQFQAQLSPWFAAFCGYAMYRETPGWSDASAQPISLTTSSMDFTYLGFEIQVSSHLRFLQELYLPIRGENIYSEFRVSTSISYTIVPLKSKYYQ